MAELNKSFNDILFDEFNRVLDIKCETDESIYNLLSKEQQTKLDKTNGYIRRLKVGIMKMYMSYDDDEPSWVIDHYSNLLQEASDSITKCIADRDQILATIKSTSQIAADTPSEHHLPTSFN